MKTRWRAEGWRLKAAPAAGTCGPLRGAALAGTRFPPSRSGWSLAGCRLVPALSLRSDLSLDRACGDGRWTAPAGSGPCGRLAGRGFAPLLSPVARAPVPGVPLGTPPFRGAAEPSRAGWDEGWPGARLTGAGVARICAAV